MSDKGLLNFSVFLNVVLLSLAIFFSHNVVYSATFDVLANDYDIDDNSLTIISTTQPDNGQVIITADNKIEFNPDTCFIGFNIFDYTITDGQGGFATATVDVETVLGHQDPKAIDDNYVIKIKDPITIVVLDNDTDPDGDSLSITTITQGSKGIATVNSDNTITYVPGKRFKNSDTFSYTITDNRCGWASASVTITLEKTKGGKGRGGGPKK